MEKKKEKRIITLLLILFAITVGYALLSQQLKVNGAASIDKTTWNVYWNNLKVTNGSVTGSQVTQAAEIDNNKTLIIHP